MGGLAFLFAIIGLIYAIRSKSKGTQIMMFCSLSLGALTVLEEINVIWNWYAWEEIVASETTPNIISTLNIALCALLGINLISLILSLKRNKK